MIPVEHVDCLCELISRAEATESWHDSSDDVRLFAVQVAADRVEVVLDPIEVALGTVEGFRAFVLPVEAVLPWAPEPEVKAQMTNRMRH